MRWILLLFFCAATATTAEQWSVEEGGKHLRATENLIDFLCPAAESNIERDVCWNTVPNHTVFFAACVTAFEKGPAQIECFERVFAVWSNETVEKYRPELLPKTD